MNHIATAVVFGIIPHGNGSGHVCIIIYNHKLWLNSPNPLNIPQLKAAETFAFDGLPREHKGTCSRHTGRCDSTLSLIRYELVGL